MSYTKSKGVAEPRRSPVNGTKSSNKSKPSKVKVAKAAPGKAATVPSNGFHVVEPVSNGVEKRKDAKATKEESQVAKINLLTLQKVDKSVCEIVETVPHVVLYQFKSTENVWERTSSEGTLFVYKRFEKSLQAGFMILNRLNSENTKELIVPGMEFRLQPPFVLYSKDSGSIFGLCIQDEELCSKTSKLLNKLSARSSSGRNSDSSGSSSSSASSPPDVHQDQGAGRGHNADTVMESLETAGRSYLGGQCFSDDADSHDETNSSSSPLPLPPPPANKGGVASSKTTPNTSQSNNGNPNGVRATSPREIPHNQGVASSYPYPLPQQQQQQQQSPHTPLSQYQHRKVSSPSVWYGHAHPNVAGAGPGPGQQQQQHHPPPHPHQHHHHHHHGVLQHSASFDQFRMVPPGSAPPQQPHQHHSHRSHSLITSPYSSHPPPPHQHYYSAYLPSRAHSAAAGSTDNSIVRKLFEPQASEPPVSSSVSVSLKTLFSQASTSSSAGRLQLSSSSSSSTTTTTPTPGKQLPRQQPHPRPLLVSALSLDEIEKQLTEEAPAPGSAKVGGLPKGVHDRSAAATTTSSSSNARSSSSDSSVGKVAAIAGSASQHTVLMQPSAFAVQAPPVPKTLPTMSATPATASGVINVQPPTPLSDGPATSSQQRQQVFPPIPPIMLSAGMTAPPLNRNHPQQQQSPAKGSPSKQKKVVQHSTAVKAAVAASAASSNLITRGVADPTSHTPKGRAPIQNGSPDLDHTLIPGRSFTEPVGTTLMSPQQFSQSTEQGGGGGGGKQIPPTTNSKETDIGLTKTQMQEALIYMIQNDHGFVDKLHEAYKMSLTKRLS